MFCIRLQDFWSESWLAEKTTRFLKFRFWFSPGLMATQNSLIKTITAEHIVMCKLQYQDHCNGACLRGDTVVLWETVALLSVRRVGHGWVAVQTELSQKIILQLVAWELNAHMQAKILWSCTENKQFFLKQTENGWRLKENHSYCYQCQGVANI